jgi:hypothetical protein
MRFCHIAIIRFKIDSCLYSYSYLWMLSSHLPCLSSLIALKRKLNSSEAGTPHIDRSDNWVYVIFYLSIMLQFMCFLSLLNKLRREKHDIKSRE